MSAWRILPSLVVFLFWSGSLRAEFQWSDNFTWNRARIVTPEQNSWSFRSSYQQVDTRFDSAGAPENLGRPFDRTWTWNQLVSSEKNTRMRASMQDYMVKNRQLPNDIAAATAFELQRRETTFDVAWAYGLTSHWMIGLEVPVSLIDTQLQPNTKMTPLLSGFRGPGSSLASQAQMQKHVAALVNNQLSSEGYDAIQARTQNVIVGDVSVLSQFSLWENQDWAFSLQQLLRIPSAPNDSVADYIRYSQSDGAIDLGMTALADYKWRRFLIGAKLGYVYSIPDVQRMRAPVAEDQTLMIVDRNVHRDLGDLITASLESFYQVSRRWSVNTAYLGFFKGPDRYTGSTPDVAYSELGADSQEQLHLARAGVSYLMGRPVSRLGLERKWITNFNIYQPIAGRNISQGTEAALEMQAFF